MLTVLAAVTIGIHAASVHVPEEPNQNNFNPGVYARTDAGLTVGVYRNTLRRTSVYATYQFPVGPVDVAVGVVSGYQKKCGDWGPWAEDAQGVPHRQRDCVGSSKYALMPVIVPSYALPEVGGFVPRVSVAVGASTAVHLGFERRW